MLLTKYIAITTKGRLHAWGEKGVSAAWTKGDPNETKEIQRKYKGGRHVGSTPRVCAASISQPPCAPQSYTTPSFFYFHPGGLHKTNKNPFTFSGLPPSSTAPIFKTGRTFFLRFLHIWRISSPNFFFVIGKFKKIDVREWWIFKRCKKSPKLSGKLNSVNGRDHMDTWIRGYVDTRIRGCVS